MSGYPVKTVGDIDNLKQSIQNVQNTLQGKPTPDWSQLRERMTAINLVHPYLLWNAENLGFKLSTTTLIYFENGPPLKYKSCLLRNSMPSWTGCFHSISHSRQKMPYPTYFSLEWLWIGFILCRLHFTAKRVGISLILFSFPSSDFSEGVVLLLIRHRWTKETWWLCKQTCCAGCRRRPFTMQLHQ